MNHRKELIDTLVAQFWADGYKIVHRKFGNYLTDPPKIGEFQIDILARKGNRFAMGIVLEEKDFWNNNLAEMFNFLATRKSKFANAASLLYIGVEPSLYVKLAGILYKMDKNISINIRSFPLQLIPELTLMNGTQKHQEATAATFFR